ncbi:hypothetical protein [Pedobacter nyackensis]|uniref:Uncharacterized protein n=1 Tax=Pedobacter nyackensis TaxID=475255 RepID=A0A1W2A886_9SPHI|nr:hypothetical protein [Pedobacter nyackensis]SMC56682.1 hypothetical protein SAMN04488101_101291 [Pedobacter nyackensis]
MCFSIGYMCTTAFLTKLEVEFALKPVGLMVVAPKMDLKDATTEKNPAVSLFGVAGIPAKFVIDGSGHIRFKMSGFGGTNDSAVAELSAMIELSRKSI